jgi:DNA segregation ATPase FtsK/SpoIIIE-like protein
MFKNKFNLDTQSQLTLLIIASFALSLLLYISIFGMAGMFGNLIAAFLSGFLGRASVALPIVIFSFGLFLMRIQRNKDNEKFVNNPRFNLGAVLIFLVFCGLLSLIFDVRTIDNIYNGGGLIGFLIYPYILGSFGFFGGLLILISLWIYGVFLLTGMNFVQFVDNVQATIKNPSNFWEFVPDIFVPAVNSQKKEEKKVEEPPKPVENLTSIQAKLDPKFKANTQNTEYSAYETVSKIPEMALREAEMREKKLAQERDKTVSYFQSMEEQMESNNFNPKVAQYQADNEDNPKFKKFEMETESSVNPETLAFMNSISGKNPTKNWRDSGSDDDLEETEKDEITDEKGGDFDDELDKILDQTLYTDSALRGKISPQELLEKIIEERLARKMKTNFDNPKNDVPNFILPDQKPNSNSVGFSSKVNNSTSVPAPKSSEPIKWTLPPFELLGENKIKAEIGGDVESNEKTIQETLKNFGITVEMGTSVIGPTVTQYTLKPASGVKLSSINSLQKDLTLALAATSIRMEMPISGQSWVGLQIPNRVRSQVRLRDILHTNEFFTFPDSLPVAVGKDVGGANMIFSITKMPHLLVAGSTGAGKSVWINSMLLSLLYRYSPADLQIILVDMKRVELKLYDKIPHLLSDVITDAEKAINALKWTVVEMDRRYKLLEKYGKRNIGDYNAFVADINEKVAKSPEKFEKLEMLPYMVFVIDELGDLMMLAKNEVEPIVVRLTQMSRAVGIHLVLGTQRPDVQVVTGLIKANIPTRICFAVVTQIDSRVVLGVQGAENLVGQGDGLILTPSVMQPIRFQGAFVEEKEVRECCQYIKIQAAKNAGFTNFKPEVTEPPVAFAGVPGLAKTAKKASSKPNNDGLFLYEEARKMVLQYGQCSPEFLMEILLIDKKTAKKILNEMEEEGVIGPEMPGNRERDIYAVD